MENALRYQQWVNLISSILALWSQVFTYNEPLYLEKRHGTCWSSIIVGRNVLDLIRWLHSHRRCSLVHLHDREMVKPCATVESERVLANIRAIA